MAKLQDQVKVTKDKKKRDELQDEISLLKAKSQLAESKRVKMIVSPSHKLITPRCRDSDVTITSWIQCV